MKYIRRRSAKRVTRAPLGARANERADARVRGRVVVRQASAVSDSPRQRRRRLKYIRCAQQRRGRRGAVELYHTPANEETRAHLVPKRLSTRPSTLMYNKLYRHRILSLRTHTHRIYIIYNVTRSSWLHLSFYDISLFCAVIHPLVSRYVWIKLLYTCLLYICMNIITFDVPIMSI